MSDTASLKIAINTSEIKTANDELNKLSNTSGKAEKSTQGVTKSFSALNAVLTVGAVSAVAAQYIKLADTMTGVQSKLKLVTSSTNELATAQNELFKIAQTTRQGFAETVDTFSNFAVAMGEMGKSQKEILRVTETVNKAIAISGGTAQQAAAATMQLGQAFASGTLRGDELNSILENSKGLAQAIADGMGVPIGKLRTLGSEGKITAEILATALEKSAKSVDDKFAKVGVTVSASVTQMENSLLGLVGEADQAMNGSGGISDTFSFFAKAMDNNRAEIIESGKDAYRGMQMMGIGMVQLGATFYQGVVAIPTAIALAVDTTTQLMENGLNNMIGMAEDATNKITSLYGGDKVSIGRVDIDTNLSKDLLSHYNAIVETQKTAITAQGKLYDEIMSNTTEIKKIAPPSDKGSGKKGGATAETEEQKKARLKAEKEAEKAREEQRKRDKEDADFALQTAIEANQKRKALLDEEAKLQAENALAMYDQHLKFSLSTFEYDMMKLDEQKEIYMRATEDKLAVDVWYQEQKTALMNKEASVDVSKSLEPMQTMLDTQISLAESGQDWASSLDGVAGSMADVIKGMSKVNVIGLKADKARIASQEKYAKSFLEANGDIKKEKEAEAEFDNEQNTIKNNQFQNEINAYSDMAGSMAGFFEQGSTGAKAMAIVQGGLAIVSAGAGGDPYTVIPRMIAAAAVVHQALSASGISGGGATAGNSIASGNNFDYNREMIESNYTPMTDRLDRQIELLESIDKNGSASQLGVSLAATSFQRDYALWVEDTLEKARLTAYSAMSFSETKQLTDTAEAISGVDIYKVRGSDLALNTTILREGTNLVKALQASLEMQWGTFGQGEVTTWDANGHQQMLSSIRNSLNEMQNLVQEWAMGVVESMDDLKDASADFKGYFDEVTGSMFYETERLKQAFDDVNRLSGGSSFADYLQTNINEIDALQKFFTDDTFALLMSDSFDDIDAQMAKIQELSALTGKTFEGGAREALNYLESIELVAEAMARSRENISSFTSSLMTSEAASIALASSLGETLATYVDGLAQMFFRLSNDMDGLTDADLELLNANLELLKNTDSLTATQDAYNESLQATQNSISTLNGALGNIQSTIDKLRGAAGGADYTMEMFRQSMSSALNLSDTSNYEDFAKAVQEATGYSSALMDSSNFEFSRDQKFAQAVAANQFEALEKSTLSQIDYLKMIEENTRGQLEILSGSINNLSNSINNELLQAITNPISGSSGIVKSAFEQVLGRTPDTTSAGFKYWTGAVDSGSISADILNQSIASGASSKNDVYAALDWFANDYANKQEGRGLALLDSSFSKGILSSLEAAKLFDEYALPNNSFSDSTLESLGYANLKKYISQSEIASFDVGTARVTQDMLAKIHKDEIITPAPMSEGLRNGTLVMGDQSGMIAEMRAMREDMAKLMKVNNEYQEKIDRNTKTSKFAGA